MDKPAVLVYGYAPERTKVVEALVAGQSKDCDVLRLGPHIRIGQIRAMFRFCSVAPMDSESKARTVVLYLESMTDDAQNALLRVIEEPPANVVFVLVKANTYKVFGTT